MEVAAELESLQHVGVGGEVGEDAELELAVVGDDELHRLAGVPRAGRAAGRRRGEGLADLAQPGTPEAAVRAQTRLQPAPRIRGVGPQHTW